MNCEEIEEVIHGYLDGELDAAHSLATEQHLKECPACAAAYRQQQSLRTALAGRWLYFNAPTALAGRVRSALRQENKRVGRDWGRYWNWGWASLLAPFAAACLVMLIAPPLITRHAAENRLVEEIASAHARSLMVDHRTDIASSDRHTVKPWFDGKLHFAPPVVDLAEHGFRLAGGRLDYLQRLPVAALVYQRHNHFINLFVWPSVSYSNLNQKAAVHQGYNLIHWTESGMTYWAVSDLDRAELSNFRTAYQMNPR